MPEARTIRSPFAAGDLHPTRAHITLAQCLPAGDHAACKRQTAPDGEEEYLNVLIETGAGEGIRTLDPNLGKVVLYP